MADDERLYILRAAGPPLPRVKIDEILANPAQTIQQREIAALFNMTMENVLDGLLFHIRSCLRQDPDMTRRYPQDATFDADAWNLRAGSLQRRRLNDWIIKVVSDLHPELNAVQATTVGTRVRQHTDPDGSVVEMQLLTPTDFQVIIGRIIDAEARKIRSKPALRFLHNDTGLDKRASYYDKSPRKVDKPSIRTKKRYGFAHQPLWIVKESEYETFSSRQGGTSESDKRETAMILFKSLIKGNVDMRPSTWTSQDFELDKLLQQIHKRWPCSSMHKDIHLKYHRGSGDISEQINVVDDEARVSVLDDMLEQVKVGDYEFIVIIPDAATISFVGP